MHGVGSDAHGGGGMAEWLKHMHQRIYAQPSLLPATAQLAQIAQIANSSALIGQMPQLTLPTAVAPRSATMSSRIRMVVPCPCMHMAPMRTGSTECTPPSPPPALAAQAVLCCDAVTADSAVSIAPRVGNGHRRCSQPHPRTSDAPHCCCCCCCCCRCCCRRRRRPNACAPVCSGQGARLPGPRPAAGGPHRLPARGHPCRSVRARAHACTQPPVHTLWPHPRA